MCSGESRSLGLAEVNALAGEATEAGERLRGVAGLDERDGHERSSWDDDDHLGKLKITRRVPRGVESLLLGADPICPRGTIHLECALRVALHENRLCVDGGLPIHGRDGELDTGRSSSGTSATYATDDFESRRPGDAGRRIDGSRLRAGSGTRRATAHA